MVFMITFVLWFCVYHKQDGKGCNHYICRGNWAKLAKQVGFLSNVIYHEREQVGRKWRLFNQNKVIDVNTTYAKVIQQNWQIGGFHAQDLQHNKNMAYQERKSHTHTRKQTNFNVKSFF